MEQQGNSYANSNVLVSYKGSLRSGDLFVLKLCAGGCPKPHSRRLDQKKSAEFRSTVCRLIGNSRDGINFLSL
jgi:hypothetical protein